VEIPVTGEGKRFSETEVGDSTRGFCVLYSSWADFAENLKLRKGGLRSKPVGWCFSRVGDDKVGS